MAPSPSAIRSRVKRPIAGKINFKRLFNYFIELLTNPKYSWIISWLLLFIEFFVTSIVIRKIPYTEIDWKAYMQEVGGVLNGTFDYKELKGDTGPLVYPAGFVYIYLILYAITQRGVNIFVAQHLFALLYLSTLYVVFRLYKRSTIVPPYALIFMCCTSYRIHSIYVLRLFNDPVAIFFLFLAVNCFADKKWLIGSILFSFAVSVKMNILLFAPGLLFILLHSTGWLTTLLCIMLCALVQIIVGLPFLIANPVNYISHAFDLGRIFLHQWTVNWRFVPEDIFVNHYFHIVLLILHLLSLALFAYKWKRDFGLGAATGSKNTVPLTLDNLLFVLFTSNLVGIIFSRSLHYQFYVWYFFTLPHILWATNYNPVLKLCILGLLELSWNTYPSTFLSSGLLHVCHFLMISGLLFCAHKRKTEKNL